MAFCARILYWLLLDLNPTDEHSRQEHHEILTAAAIDQQRGTEYIMWAPVAYRWPQTLFLKALLLISTWMAWRVQRCCQSVTGLSTDIVNWWKEEFFYFQILCGYRVLLFFSVGENYYRPVINREFLFCPAYGRPCCICRECGPVHSP